MRVKGIKYVVISIMGPHAGESEEGIFKRKIGDTNKVGKTFWLMRSHQAKPFMVQRFCEKAKSKNVEALTVFIEPSSTGGAIPTKTAEVARSYSKNKGIWKELPKGLTPVTGKISNNTYALVFNDLKLESDEIDLWNYANFSDQSKPIEIRQGASTLCTVKKDMSKHKDKMKSHYRRILAVGKLCEPFCVWLR